MGSKKNTKQKNSRKKAEIRSKRPGKTIHQKLNFSWLHIAFLVLVTSIVFAPSLQNEFVNWDDDRNFYENELIETLNDENFWINSKKIFQTHVIGNYNPLTIFTFALEKRFFGFEKPFYWHLNNLLLHLLCVIMVYLICIQMKLDPLVALFVAILFGIHPMRVESVAWVTERKDVLFGAFYFLSIFYYIKYTRVKQKPYYILLVWIFFILSLLSKIQAVILPVSFILLDYYFDRKLSMRKILRKTPYLIASLVIGIIGIYFLQMQDSLESNSTFQLYERIFIGSYSYVVYLVKSVVPYQMSALYPYPSSLPIYFYPTIIVFVALPILLWKLYIRKKHILFFGISFFTVNIFFLLQILGAGQGFIADRFTYVAYFGIFVIFGYYFHRLLQHSTLQKFIPYAFLLPIIAYSFFTFHQCKVWKNSETLWTHVIKTSNLSTLPYGNRANYYRDKGMIKEALRDYTTTINLKSTKPGPYNSRGKLYFAYDNPDSLRIALSDYDNAIRLAPEVGEYCINRGATYSKLGDQQRALQDFNKGIELNPSFPNGYLNRSLIYFHNKDLDAAISDLTKYLSYKPYSPDIWFERGKAKNLLHRYSQAIPDFDRAIQLNNKKGIYFFERAKAHYSVGKYPQAKNDINTSIQLGYKGVKEVVDRILGG